MYPILMERGPAAGGEALTDNDNDNGYDDDDGQGVSADECGGAQGGDGDDGDVPGGDGCGNDDEEECGGARRY